MRKDGLQSMVMWGFHLGTIKSITFHVLWSIIETSRIKYFSPQFERYQDFFSMEMDFFLGGKKATWKVSSTFCFDQLQDYVALNASYDKWIHIISTIFYIKCKG